LRAVRAVPKATFQRHMGGLGYLTSDCQFAFCISGRDFFGYAWSNKLIEGSISMHLFTENDMPEWIQWLLEEASENQIVNWILKSQKVSLADHCLTGEERVTFALSILSSRYKVNCIFQSPYLNVRMSIAVTAGLMISDFVFRRKENKPLMNGDLLLITRQIGVGVSELNQVNLAGQLLSDFWEVTTANTAKPNTKERNPRLIVSAPRPGSLAHPKIKVDTVVIDATHPLTLERLNEILSDPLVHPAKQIVVIVPLGYNLEIFQDERPLWTWDFQAIQAARDQWKSSFNSIAIPQKWSRKYFVCSDEKTDSLLSTARKKLGLLSKHSGDNPPLQLLQAWGIYNQLSSLSVKLGAYEEMAFRHNYARPIHEKIDYLNNSLPALQLRHESKDVWASEWRPLLDSLSGAYENLKGNEPSKFWPIAFLVDKLIADNFPVPLLVICSTHIEGNILIKNLASLNPKLYDFLHPEGITIATPKSLAGYSNRQPSRILLSGTLSARWRYLYVTISDLDAIVYPHEIFSDTYILESQIKKVLSSSSLQNRYTFLTSLSSSSIKKIDSPLAEDFDLAKYIDIETVTDDAIPTRYPYITREVDLNTLSSPDWTWDAEDITYVPPLQSNTAYANRYQIFPNIADIEGPKVVIILDGGEKIVVPSGQVFDVYRPITDELEEQVSESIESGDILVLVQDSNYYRLFDRIVEALENHQNFALMSVWLKLWEVIKQELLADCQNDISCLHKKLTQRGVEISEQAVRNWYRGIMAPGDENIIFLMLEISSNKSGSSNKSKIRDALGHVRGMRRAAGRRIREVIKQTAISKQPERFTDALDIALEDVMAACSTRRVQSVEHLT
jgi:hypothetical protein